MIFIAQLLCHYELIISARLERTIALSLFSNFAQWRWASASSKPQVSHRKSI